MVNNVIKVSIFDDLIGKKAKKTNTITSFPWPFLTKPHPYLFIYFRHVL